MLGRELENGNRETRAGKQDGDEKQVVQKKTPCAARVPPQRRKMNPIASQIRSARFALDSRVEDGKGRWIVENEAKLAVCTVCVCVCVFGERRKGGRDRCMTPERHGPRADAMAQWAGGDGK